jgi:hypothetical protein
MRWQAAKLIGNARNVDISTMGVGALIVIAFAIGQMTVTPSALNTV